MTIAYGERSETVAEDTVLSPPAHGRILDISWLLMAAACWIFTRQYHGVIGDSLIYLGRALADLSPATVGQDLMFLHDGQSSFSLFPILARVLVGHFGAPFASAVLAFTAVALWFATFAALAHRLAPGRTAWVMVMFVALLPATYGGFLIIPYAQAIAIPRPFAEAAVLAALWAAMGRRWALASVFLVVAGLFHPIMALCGVGVVFLLIGMEDKRWFIAAAVLGGLVLIAAFMGAPLASRLVHRVDPTWLSLLQRRNPYLFPALWPAETWAHTGVQLATTGLAAVVLTGRARALFICVAIIGVAGVALTFVLGDLYPSLLVLQVQPWRALWLVAVFAAAGTAVCATTLWRRGPLGHLTLVLLALSWLSMDSPFAVVTATAALGLQLGAKWIGEGVSTRLARVAWALLIASIAYQVLLDGFVISPIMRSVSPDSQPLETILNVFDFQKLILFLIVWLFFSAAFIRSRGVQVVMLVSSVAAIMLAALCWSAAPASQTFQGPAPSLVAMIKSRPGAVQWINGDTQAWTLAGRPLWGGQLQGASNVFAHDAALAWQGRVSRLVSLHLISDTPTPWVTMDPHIVHPSTRELAALCTRPGGPAWIISPVLQGRPAPALTGVRLWRAPYVSYLQTTSTPTSATFSAVDTYAVIPCADQGQAGYGKPRPRPTALTGRLRAPWRGS